VQSPNEFSDMGKGGRWVLVLVGLLLLSAALCDRGFRTAAVLPGGGGGGARPSRDLTQVDSEAVGRPVVVATADGQLLGVDSAGRVLWSFASGAPLLPAAPDDAGSDASVDPGGAATPPLVLPAADGALFVHADGAGFMALNLSVQDVVANSPFLSRDGLVFVGTKTTAVFTYDFRTMAVSLALADADAAEACGWPKPRPWQILSPTARTRRRTTPRTETATANRW
jgi:hypothetical protein